MQGRLSLCGCCTLIINVAGNDGETLAMVITDDNTGMRCPFPLIDDRSGESVVDVFNVPVHQKSIRFHNCSRSTHEIAFASLSKNFRGNAYQ